MHCLEIGLLSRDAHAKGMLMFFLWKKSKGGGGKIMPTSERQLKPWGSLNISRTTYYKRKKISDDKNKV